jgi:NAD(P)-dependent dehydrogenase (short-subunit alcohol dehydrogenase family)
VTVTQAFLPLLRQRGDQAYHHRVVFVGSGFGRTTFPLVGPYAATKHAMGAIGDAFRMELQSWGIRVVVVEPGSIKTNFMEVTKGNHAENVLQKDDPSHGDPVAKQYAERSSTMMKNQIVMERLFSTTKVTSDVLEGTILDVEPLSRYTAGADSSFGIPVITQLPTFLTDRLFGRFFR